MVAPERTWQNYNEKVKVEISEWKESGLSLL